MNQGSEFLSMQNQDMPPVKYDSRFLQEKRVFSESFVAYNDSIFKREVFLWSILNRKFFQEYFFSRIILVEKKFSPSEKKNFFFQNLSGQNEEGFKCRQLETQPD